MKFRETTIQALANHAAAGTDTYPIRLTDPISRLRIPYGVLVGAGARLAHISNAITRIVIVDGSDVLLSLTGEQIDGIGRMDAIAASSTFSTDNPTVTDWGTLIIDFGRFLYDKQIALDASKFKNPQIQVTHNFATVNAAATGLQYAILADVMEGLSANPIGFLMKKEAKSWLAAAATWEYTQLARDFIYRRLWLQGHTVRVGVAGHFSTVILQENNYARIPIQVDVWDQIASNAADYGLITENIQGNISAITDPLFACPCYAASIHVVNSVAAAAWQGIVQDGGEYEVVIAGGVTPWRGIVSGLSPHGLVVYNLGPKDVIEDWYDPTAIGSLQLEVLGGGVRTVRMVTEQLRPNVGR